MTKALGHNNCVTEGLCSHRVRKLRRGRDAGYPAPPAQIPASGITALGSYLRW